MGVEWWAFAVSVLAVVIAAVGAWYARREARAAERQAEAAREQVETAAEQAEAAREQADAAKRQVAIDEQIQRDTAQPYVYADLRPDERTGSLILLVIENTGRTVARNVRVFFEPELESVAFPRISTVRALKDGIRSMPPGRRQVWFFDSAIDRFNERGSHLPQRYHVKVTADGPFDRVEPLEYDLDLADWLKTEGRGAGSLKDVAEGLKSLKKGLDKIEIKLGRS